MKAARAAIVLAGSSVLQMFEAIRDAMPAGDTKITAVTCISENPCVECQPLHGLGKVFGATYA